MLHDEQLFPNPKVFNPDRFLREGILNTHIPDPEVFATFGFGRRYALPILMVVKAFIQLLIGSARDRMLDWLCFISLLSPY